MMLWRLKGAEVAAFWQCTSMLPAGAGAVAATLHLSMKSRLGLDRGTYRYIWGEVRAPDRRVGEDYELVFGW